MAARQRRDTEPSQRLDAQHNSPGPHSGTRQNSFGERLQQSECATSAMFVATLLDPGHTQPSPSAHVSRQKVRHGPLSEVLTIVRVSPSRITADPIRQKAGLRTRQLNKPSHRSSTQTPD
jgi:hypothetical protein